MNKLFFYIILSLLSVKYNPFFLKVISLDAKTIHVEVINSSDKTKIPYATIIYNSKKKGFNSDVDGSFVFDWKNALDLSGRASEMNNCPFMYF